MEQEMNPQNLEQNPDETAAVLSFATKISEDLMPKNQKMQENGATIDENKKDELDIKEKSSETDLKSDNKDMEKVMDSKLDELRKEIKEVIKEEISGIKDSIQEALKEDE